MSKVGDNIYMFCYTKRESNGYDRLSSESITELQRVDSDYLFKYKSDEGEGSFFSQLYTNGIVEREVIFRSKVTAYYMFTRVFIDMDFDNSSVFNSYLPSSSVVESFTSLKDILIPLVREIKLSSLSG